MIQPAWNERSAHMELACGAIGSSGDGPKFACTRPTGHQGRHVAFSRDFKQTRPATPDDPGYCDAWPNILSPSEVRDALHDLRKIEEALR